MGERERVWGEKALPFAKERPFRLVAYAERSPIAT